MTSVIRGDDNFDSGDQITLAPAYNTGPVTYSTSQTVSHGLGRVPYMYDIRIRCKAANNGYSVGDEMSVKNMVDGDGARGYLGYVNASTMNYRADTINIQNTSADYATGSASQWDLVFYAW